MKKLLLLLSIILAPLAAMAQEPYAVLSGDKTNLTFYYDDQKEARSGMGVGPFTLSSEHVNSGWDEYRENITSVVFDPSFAGYTSLTSTAYWFYGFTSLETITGVDYLNTVGVTTSPDSVTVYDLNGRLLKEMPRKRGVYIVTGQQGVNIVVGSDGTRRKVLVK